MIPTRKHRGSQTKWNLRSLIDLEIEIAKDEQSGATTEALNERDREIGREIREAIERKEFSRDDRRSILAWWLAAQKRNRSDTRRFSTFGEAIASSLLGINVASFFFIGAGFVFAWGAFNIELDETGGLNVYVIWLLTTGLPLLLTLLSVLASLPFVRSKIFHDSMPLRNALANLLDRCWRLAPTYEKWKDVADLFKVRLVGSGGVLGTHLVSVLHLFSLSTVVGIALAIGLFKSIEDQTYGWQSHDDEAAMTVAKRVETLSVFWAWFDPAGEGYPSKSQVQASQLPISPERVHDARAARMPWIRFFWWSAIFYAVIPRFLLWCVSLAAVQWRLRNEEFKDLIFQDLCRRLAYPSGGFKSPDQAEFIRSERIGSDASNLPQSDNAILLVPAAFFTGKVVQRVGASLADQHSLGFGKSFALPSLPGEQEKFFAKMKAELTEAPETILLLQLSFRPPTEAFSDLIDALRTAFGERTALLIILIGDLPEREFPEEVTEMHLNGWSRFIRRLADPNLRCHKLDLAPAQ